MTEDQSSTPSAPSPVLWVTGLPDEDDDGELEMRLARVGELLKLERDGQVAVATFRNTKAAVDAQERLNGFTLASGRAICISFAPNPKARAGDVEGVAGDFFRSNREIHWKIGQLVRSTYSAMRATNGNYPPPKQSLVPDDFKYLESLEEPLEMESKWSPSMSIDEKLKDYDEFAERRPFHNRYIVIRIRDGSPKSIFEIGNYIKAVLGPQNLLELLEFNDHSIFHAALKSTKDASILLSSINQSLSKGEGGLVDTLSVESVKYAPPVDMAGNPGKLWFGCSAFLAIDEDKLKTMLCLFGELQSFRLVKNKNCLFASFLSDEQAVACRNKLFAYEIAPGHFLNVDYSPPAPEYVENSSGHKRRYSNDGQDYAIPPKRAPVEDSRTARLNLKKMGEWACSVLARKFVLQKMGSDDPHLSFPREIDICNRTKIDYCKMHLEKLGCSGPVELGVTNSSDLGPIVLWQFAAATDRDCRGYDSLCDYFVAKERVGFYTSPDGSVSTYFIPPVAQFLEPLGLPTDSKYLTALQMPALGQIGNQQ